jgi:anti-anti-sigma factor
MSVTSGRPSSFGVITSLEGGDTVLALRGSVENGAAFELGAVLDSAIERHPASMVLDLSALDFMGPAGLVAISNAEKRLAGLGIQLTVRSPSALLDRLIDIMARAEVVRLEAASPGHGHLGTEQIGEMPSAGPPGVGGLSSDLRKVTAMPADPDVVDGALRLLVELALSCVEGADGASVSLLRHGLISTVAASDQTIMDMDADQYATSQGPCLDASLRGRWFHAEALATETRWPSFTPRALGLGINAILSSPLRAFDAPVGALNIYSRTASAFDIGAQETAALFAQKASMILSDAGAGVTDSQMAARFFEALSSRKVIAQAQGIIMEREGVDEGVAFKALLRLSLYHGVPLGNQAETLVLSARQPTLGPQWGPDA